MLTSRRRLRGLAVTAVLALGCALLSSAAASAQYPLSTGALTVDAGGSSAALSPGDPVGLAGGGFQPGADVQIWLHSDPILITTVNASDTGAIDVTVRIPSNAAPGRHTLQARGAAPGGGTTVLAAPVVVASSAAAGDAPEKGTAEKLAGGRSDTSGGEASPRPVEASGLRGTLPFTGLPVVVVLVTGFVLVLVGGALSLVTRGRRDD